MHFSNEEIARGRAVVELKRKYENIARTWSMLSKNQQIAYERQNLSPQRHPTTGEFVYAFLPDQFVFEVLGVHRWSHACYTSQGSMHTVVNPWLVAGGLRKKKWFNIESNTFKELIPDFDADTKIGDSASGSMTSWLKPFPLLWANEGKNRIKSYQDENINLFTLADICEFMPADSLRLYKSVLDSSVWLLRYVGNGDRNWDLKIQRMIGSHSQTLEKVILPYPEVGVPLLINYGVKVDTGWGLPWRISKHAQVRENKIVRSEGWS